MKPGSLVRLPCGTIRKVAAARDGVLHFFTVVKQADGRTHYWADAVDCTVPSAHELYMRAALRSHHSV